MESDGYDQTLKKNKAKMEVFFFLQFFFSPASFSFLFFPPRLLEWFEITNHSQLVSQLLVDTPSKWPSVGERTYVCKGTHPAEDGVGSTGMGSLSHECWRVHT